MKSDRYSSIYIGLLFVAFAAMAIVFNFFPRSTISVLEKRELASFPEFSVKKILSGEFTKDVSSWYSDSEPYRDGLMMLSMTFKEWTGMVLADDNVRFHAAKPSSSAAASANRGGGDGDGGDYVNNITADDNAKIANAGIIIVGTGANVRALMAYGGVKEGGWLFAKAVNKYKEVFGDKVQVYCMVIPTAAEYYCPDKVRSCTRPQRPTIENIHSKLNSNVKAVDIYPVLGQHAREAIYLRTDHHWSPLGAYYAAQTFAKVAGVPFKTLGSYEQKVVHRFVGSMYGYSNDIAVKKAPEDFVYYEPKDVTYTTTYINYKVDKDYHIISVSKPCKSVFFCHMKDGSAGAYCTFMGSDMKITQVRTSTKNGRRLMILKDSFGNALPGYLFYSFEEIHIVDYRYFARNMKKYVEENKITDILFANNIFTAYSPDIYDRYASFLTQGDNVMFVPKPEAKPDAKSATKSVSKASSDANARSQHGQTEKHQDAPSDAVVPNTDSPKSKSTTSESAADE